MNIFLHETDFCFPAKNKTNMVREKSKFVCTCYVIVFFMTRAANVNFIVSKSIVFSRSFPILTF